MSIIRNLAVARMASLAAAKTTQASVVSYEGEAPGFGALGMVMRVVRSPKVAFA